MGNYYDSWFRVNFVVRIKNFAAYAKANINLTFHICVGEWRDISINCKIKKKKKRGNKNL